VKGIEMHHDTILGDQSEPWFILHTLSNHEKSVGAHLYGRDVEHYLPMYTTDRKGRNLKVALELPLFPGYVFTRFVRTQQMTVLTVPGILNILKAPGGLATISNREIRSLHEGLLRSLPLLPSNPYTTGNRVRIVRGVFQGYEAHVSESNKSGALSLRVVISAGSINSCSFSLDINPSDVELLPMYRNPQRRSSLNPAPYGTSDLAASSLSVPA
jgi:transcription antitermination factor NusG